MYKHDTKVSVLSARFPPRWKDEEQIAVVRLESLAQLINLHANESSTDYGREGERAGEVTYQVDRGDVWFAEKSVRRPHIAARKFYEVGIVNRRASFGEFHAVEPPPWNTLPHFVRSVHDRPNVFDLIGELIDLRFQPSVIGT